MLLTMEDVLRPVQTMLDHLSVVVEVDTLLLAMDFYAMVCTDCTNLKLTLLHMPIHWITHCKLRCTA